MKTVNTAARMESNSSPGRIMCSRKTADLIIASGKEHWVTPRVDLVVAKGKGAMQCYWCDPSSGDNNTVQSSVNSYKEIESRPDRGIELPGMRHLDWMVDLFEGMLNAIIAQRDPNVTLGQEPAPTEFTCDSQIKTKVCRSC
jgi:Adenylate and Guanylate cyclase catalytic domain